MRKGTTYISVSNNANSFPHQFNTTIIFAKPFAFTYFFVSTTNVIEQTKQHSNRVFCNCIIAW